MSLQEINLKLQQLRSEAATINSQLFLSDISREEKKDLKRRYMTLAAEIADLKSKKVKLDQQALKEADNKSKIKIASLFFPGDGNANPPRVKYFATELDYLELTLMLNEVYGDEKPAISSFYLVTETPDSKIPKDWFELEDFNEESI
jgi:hypothetical protein